MAGEFNSIFQNIEEMQKKLGGYEKIAGAKEYLALLMEKLLMGEESLTEDLAENAFIEYKKQILTELGEPTKESNKS